MANKKDMRREDLVVPHVPPPPKKAAEGDISSMLSSTLPMVAMFTKNRIIGWTAVLFALQNWLAETPEQRKTAGQSSLVAVGLSMLSVGVTYMQLFVTPMTPKAAPTGTEAPPAVPPPDEAW